MNAGNNGIEQNTHYYPYGELISDISTNPNVQKYKYGSKELDRSFGLDLYDFHARLHDAKLGCFTSIDPLAEDFTWLTPYNYCAGDPVNCVDPDGRRPIYDMNGNFLGTDDGGLQGDYIVMNKDNFTQGMTNEEALKYSTCYVDEETIKTIEDHYKNLPNRPDWDGELTLEEANEWFRNGKGDPLFVNASKVDLSNYKSLGDDYIGKNYTFNTLFSSKHGRIFGNLNFKRIPDDRVKISKDIYDFDIKEWSKYPVRNILTIIGSWVAGDGKSYNI